MTTKQGCLALMLAATAALGGCTGDGIPTTNRSMGNVEYDATFAATRQVLSQYYSVTEADPTTGTIKTRPSDAVHDKTRILSSSRTRELTRAKVSRETGQVVVELTVAVQEFSTPALRQMSPRGDTYSTVPDQTPAEMDAANTPAQTTAWRTVKYNHTLERQMLSEIYMQLHPEARRPITTEPAEPTTTPTPPGP